MLLSKDKETEAQDDYEEGTIMGPLASSSSHPPPPFQDEPGESHHLLGAFTDVPPGHHSDMPPPDFAPYEAEHFGIANGDIVSHDPHLNTDGEALYRFLLSQANTRPSYRLHCRGHHRETRTRWVSSRNNQGHSETRSETYTETIIDFDFYIDATISINDLTDPTHWSVADSEPAYRGRMVREVELPGPASGKRKAKRVERKAYKAWVEQRNAIGYPPWVDGVNGWIDGMPDETNSLKSSKTVRQWADEYCASPKYLKEFVYEKVLYGWNLQQLESAVRSSIEATPYHGSLEVEITRHASRVYVRPDNRLSRMLSNKWLKFLSILLFIFPFVWLFKRFHSRGGGRWEVCGGAYALKRWVPMSLEEEAELPPPAYQGMQSAGSSPRTVQTPTGTRRLLGLREGEWFRQWEGTITRAVMGRFQSSIPLFSPSGSSGLLLDGY